MTSAVVLTASVSTAALLATTGLPLDLLALRISEPDVTCLRVFTTRCAGSMGKTSETWIGLMGLCSHTPN